jgi:hypothetical protein
MNIIKKKIKRKAVAKTQFKALDKASLMASTMATRFLLKKGWQRFTKQEKPPKNPASLAVSWRDALLWGAVSGLVFNLAKITAHRVTTSWWQKHKGPKP